MQVNDRQTFVIKADVLVNKAAFVIGPPVVDGVRHFFEQGLFNGFGIFVVYAYDSAHGTRNLK
jgi:hypothetical protein